MRALRYTVLIADRSSGVVRRVGVSLRPAIAVALGILAVPVLMGLGAKWSAGTEIDQLRSSNAVLAVENGSYRAATGELTAQIQSLESVINDLGARATLDPQQARARPHRYCSSPFCLSSSTSCLTVPSSRRSATRVALPS